MRAVTFADTGRCRRELVRGAIGANAVVMPELQLAGSTVPPSPANMKPTLDVKHPRSWDLRLPKALGKRNPPTLSRPSSQLVAIRALVSSYQHLVARSDRQQ